MTISDLISRLTALVSSKNSTMGVDSSAQVKLGKHIDDDGDVFDSFDIIRKDGDVILQPSNKWERKRCKSLSD